MGHVPPRCQHDAGPGPVPVALNPARPGRRRAFILLLAVAALCFAALGVWQAERRSGKLALIAAVDARAHAPAMPAPGPGIPVTAQDDAYRHVSVHGTWLHDGETLVQALTEYGAGFWVLTPLRTGAGWTVLVNRGFVPSDHADPARRAATPAGEPATVSGLLRVSEPGGGFLRSNDPAANRWYSRDVSAIAAARNLADPAPYFIDADATPNPGGWPLGGLTVISFHNSHLVYAVTWFGLCGLSLFGLRHVLRDRPMDGQA